MSKTVLKNGDNKNPFISDRINKSLLTPCRRVGLSRKRKPTTIPNTPNNSLNVSISYSPLESPSTQQISTKNYDDKVINKPNNNSEIIETPQNKNDFKIKSGKSNKKSVPKRLAMEESNIKNKTIFQENEDHKNTKDGNEPELFDERNNCLKLENTILPENQKIKILLQINSTDDENSQNNIVINTSKKEKKRKKAIIESDDDFELDVKNKEVGKKATPKLFRESDDEVVLPIKGVVKQTPTYSYDSEDENSLSNLKKKTDQEKQIRTYSNRDKKIKRSLSTKKSFTENNTNLTKNLNTLSINIVRLSDENLNVPNVLELDQINLQPPQNDDEDMPVLKPIENYDPALIEDEDSSSSFTCTPDQDKFTNINIDKIKRLEKTIKEKREFLSKLEQAQIYKHIHNPEQLHSLTSVWSNGCKAALEDLLKQLQTHGPMNMDTLVKNLHIPQEFIEKINVKTD